MRSPRRLIVVTTLIACAGMSCARGDNPVAVAIPAVTIPNRLLVQGTLIPLHYRFTVKTAIPASTGSAMVFVHAVDDQGNLLWTDDHVPETPTSQWKPGAVIEYTREMLIPTHAPVSRVELELGLYDRRTGVRLPLSGRTQGQRAYHVGSLDITASDAGLAYLKGWNNIESADGLEWRWTKAEGTVALTNPHRDATLVLVVDQPIPQLVDSTGVALLVQGGQIDHLMLPPGVREIRRIPVPASALGDDDRIRVTVSVDRTFVPKSIPALHSSDGRELGVRVFTLYFEGR